VKVRGFVVLGYLYESELEKWRGQNADSRLFVYSFPEESDEAEVKHLCYCIKYIFIINYIFFYNTCPK